MRACKVLFLSAVGVSVAFSFLVAGPAARAETIDILVTGVDLAYDSPNMFDVTSDAGGSNNAAQADPVAFVVFDTESLDQTDDTDVFADILVKQVLNIPEGGGGDSSHNADSFGVDLFSTGPNAWNLNLDLDDLEVWYSGFEIALTLNGKASGVADNLSALGFPAIDPTKDTKVNFISTDLTNVNTSNGVLTSFAATGTMTISATLVPEPSTLIGLLTGALGLAAYVWRRRQRWQGV